MESFFFHEYGGSRDFFWKFLYGEFIILSSLQRKKKGIAKSYTQIKLKLPQINIRTFVNVGCSINPTLNAYELDV